MNARPGKRRFWRTESGTLACRGGTPGGVAWRRKTETVGVPGRLEGVSVAKSGSGCSSLRSLKEASLVQRKVCFLSEAGSRVEGLVGRFPSTG